MPGINIRGIKPEKKLFHNEKIDTYVTTTNFENIKFWPNNLRTLLAFEVLERNFKKNIEKLSLEEITDFLARRSELKLDDLANSIEKNGVRVPLIILNDGTLLDGNRRYFACSYLMKKNKAKDPLPAYLREIPVWVIKKEDVTEIQEQKILAEANYVSDYKVPWPLDVQAKVVCDYFDNCRSKGMTEEKAYLEIEDVYGLRKSKMREYLETRELTKEFVSSAKKNETKNIEFREIVSVKFVYFWEFRNKSYKGRGALEPKELTQVKPLFFKMIENNCFKNIKQVEPMIRAFHDKYLWKILADSQGTKIDQVEILLKEQQTIKSAEDKVRNFLKWLNNSNASEFTQATRKLLRQLADRISLIKGE